MSINKVVVSGNLTRDPELRMAGTTPVLQMSVAVNDRKKNNATGEWEDVPNYFDVVVWGTRGESLSRFLSKGSKVVVAGKLRWSQFEDKSGGKRTKVEIVADDVEFMSKKGETEQRMTFDEYQQTMMPTQEVLTEDIPF